MQNIRVVSATAKPTAKIVLELDVLPIFCSRSNNMHGGAMALLVDMATTMAVMPISTKDFWHFGGVSRIISVSYLRPIKKGITLLIKCKVVQIGKNNGMSSQRCASFLHMLTSWRSDHSHESIPEVKQSSARRR
jgi:uncharacterized protein (TIGR00369 family)